MVKKQVFVSCFNWIAVLRHRSCDTCILLLAAAAAIWCFVLSLFLSLARSFARPIHFARFFWLCIHKMTALLLFTFSSFFSHYTSSSWLLFESLAKFGFTYHIYRNARLCLFLCVNQRGEKKRLSVKCFDCSTKMELLQMFLLRFFLLFLFWNFFFLLTIYFIIFVSLSFHTAIIIQITETRSIIYCDR